MTGETNLNKLLQTIVPVLNPGSYVFCQLKTLHNINPAEVLCIFKEAEAVTIILKKEMADQLQLAYHYVAAWISLTVHSSLEAVGLTAAFSTALAKENISCNVVAAFYHDHIFVDVKDAVKAMGVLQKLSKNQ